MKRIAPIVMVSLVACGDDGGGKRPNAQECNAGFKVQGTFDQSAPKVDDNDTPNDPSDDLPIEGCFPVGTWTFTVTVDDAVEVPDLDGDGEGDRCAAPDMMPSYAFRVDRVAQTDGTGKVDKYFAKCGNEFFNLSDDVSPKDDVPDGLAGCTAALGGYQIARLKVTEGGGKECTGSLEIFDSTFKKLWNLKPSQSSNAQPGTPTTIEGYGEYTEYSEPQPIAND